MRATASPSPFDGEPTVAVLDVDLGISWPAGTARDPVLLGDLPVDRCGMVLGDASALDAFVGINGGTTDGLADVAYWGRHADQAHAVFGGEVLPRPGQPRGWLDLPIGQARARGAALTAWAEGDHSMLHHGERAYGRVYPVTLEPGEQGSTMLRWTILPDEPAASPAAAEPG